jgi:hypothetical protein
MQCREDEWVRAGGPVIWIYPPNLSAQTLRGPLARLMTTALPQCALAPMADTLDQQPMPSATDAN